MNLCVLFGRVCDVNATSNGFFFFQFETVAAMEEKSPVWIKLRHLPVELWTTEGLSTVASGIGRPLYPDAITRACTRLDFARVCVMLNVSSNLPKHVVIMMPNELGGESACKVDVEYEWLPPKCKQCVSLGHSTATCPESNKIEKPKVAVYVQKRPVQPPPRSLRLWRRMLSVQFSTRYLRRTELYIWRLELTNEVTLTKGKR
ncbi:UNVERIFIED_CONTAM: hypothetical protein Sradi_7260700 [Sesamum radiatum]|uniref:DUF4283 domain-containing protein n=1 Tax=Sesamum radiatum TaxID=300843 RepID=A0AAW2IKI1_SESRA